MAVMEFMGQVAAVAALRVTAFHPAQAAMVGTATFG
jgi:hypothetical protein